MMNYNLASNWFTWDMSSVIFWTIVSTLLWLMCQAPELRERVKQPILVGIAASLISCVDLGLFAVVPMGFFLLFSYVLGFWFTKIKMRKIADEAEEQFDKSKMRRQVDGAEKK